MSAGKAHNVYGEVKETGITKNIDGIPCDLVKQHFPVDRADGEWRWYDAYRFTAPGWDECTIVGLAAAKRVIRGRTDPAVLNTLGINPYADTKEAPARVIMPEHEDARRISVLDAIREYRDTPGRPNPQPERGDKSNPREYDR